MFYIPISLYNKVHIKFVPIKSFTRKRESVANPRSEICTKFDHNNVPFSYQDLYHRQCGDLHWPIWKCCPLNCISHISWGRYLGLPSFVDIVPEHTLRSDILRSSRRQSLGSLHLHVGWLWIKVKRIRAQVIGKSSYKKNLQHLFVCKCLNYKKQKQYTIEHR